MKPTTIAAIYFLLFFMSLFLVLPFEARAKGEGPVEHVPGQAHGVPPHFSPKRVLVRTALLAAALFLLVYLNYRFEWITLASFDGIFNPPQSRLN